MCNDWTGCTAVPLLVDCVKIGLAVQQLPLLVDCVKIGLAVQQLHLLHPSLNQVNTEQLPVCDALKPGAFLTSLSLYNRLAYGVAFNVTTSSQVDLSCAVNCHCAM